jgi:hypothetical protein
MDVPWLAKRAVPLALVLLAALSLPACGPAAASTATPSETTAIEVSNAASTSAAAQAATAAPTQAPPTPTQTVTQTAALAGPQTIFIDAPPFGTLVGSPVQLAGRTQRMPAGGQLNYQVLQAGSQVIGNGLVPVRALADGSGMFDAPLTFTIPQNGGMVTAQLFENAPDGSIAAISGVDLFVQSQFQSITIDTPPPGTQVGSPLVLTGQLARLPSQGRLSYLITNSSQQQIGAGTFDVPGTPGWPSNYAGSLTFDLPFDGDTITAQISDLDANGTVLASQSINLYVAPVPQQITIDTPPPGTLVGSPMTVTGWTVRFPANGTLNYRFTNAGGAQLGAGTLTVADNGIGGSRFSAQAAFNVPNDGGLLRLTISDPSTLDGAGAVERSIDLDVLAQYQAITIDTPPPGTQVGSPMVLTGRTNWYPNQGQLRYRVLDAAGTAIGSGAVQVAGAPGARGSFNASLTFTEPPNGGNIRVELLDQAANGSTAASSAIALVVAPPPPPQIIINTPPPGTQVGSPVVLTGRVTYMPASGQLGYRVRDAAGNAIGQGNVPVTADGRGARFNASLTFTEPALGGNIVVELSAPSPAAGGAPIAASIALYVAPRR